MFYNTKYNSLEHFIEELEKYIYYYNNERIKQKLKGMTPIQYRNHSLNSCFI